MKFQDNLAVTTEFEGNASTEKKDQVQLGDSSLLKKRSYRLMSQNKKQSGGIEQISQTEIENSQPQIQQTSKSSPGEKQASLSVEIQKSLGVGKTTRKYNMRQPRVPRSTRNSLAVVKVFDNDQVQSSCKDIQSASSQLLKKQQTPTRESKETLPPRTIDQEDEDEIIKLLQIHQRKRLEQDPMRELNEALMDRTTASLNRRQKITSFKANTIFVEEIEGKMASYVIREYDPHGHSKGQGSETVSENCSSPALKSDSSSQYNSNQYQIGLKDIDTHKTGSNKLKNSNNPNTLDQSASYNKIQIDPSVLKQGRHMDTCSTNATRRTNFDYIGGDRSENVSPDNFNDCHYLNKRNLKSYQKKKSSKYETKNERIDNRTQAASNLMTSKSDRAQGIQGSFGQSSNKSKKAQFDSYQNQILKEEQKVLSSQDNLAHIQFHKIQGDTPQLNYNQLKPSDQNIESRTTNSIINPLLAQNITSKSKNDLSLMNDFIKPLPIYNGRAADHSSKKPVSSNLIKQGLDKNKTKKSKQLKKTKAHLPDEKFKNLTFKMIGLTNMISLMNATGQSKAFYVNSLGYSSQDGPADAHMKMGGTDDLQPPNMMLNSTYQNVNAQEVQMSEEALSSLALASKQNIQQQALLNMILAEQSARTHQGQVFENSKC